MSVFRRADHGIYFVHRRFAEGHRGGQQKSYFEKVSQCTGKQCRNVFLFHSYVSVQLKSVFNLYGHRRNLSSPTRGVNRDSANDGLLRRFDRQQTSHT
jgi:hypothetical protein